MTSLSTAEPKYKTVTKAINHLSEALVGKWKWSITDHLSKFAAARAAHRKLTDGRAEVFAKVLLAQEGPDSLPLPTKRAFKRAYEHHTSGWLTAVPLREQGLALSADKFRDASKCKQAVHWMKRVPDDGTRPEVRGGTI